MSFLVHTPPQNDDGRALQLLPTRSKWWLEIELALVMLLAAAAYSSRITDLTVCGEESRRALIAQEMLPQSLPPHLSSPAKSNSAHPATPAVAA